MDLDRWVNDNNPDEQLQYSKGWWDYIHVGLHSITPLQGSV